jgi:hypothetical protein
MCSPTEADLDRLAAALARLLAAFWRRHVEQERAAEGESAARGEVRDAGARSSGSL